MSDRESWLNGWPRMGPTAVLIGSGTHCVGCGSASGVVSVAIPEGYEAPDRDPDWPFPEDNCPVCPFLHHRPAADTPWPRGQRRPLP